MFRHCVWLELKSEKNIICKKIIKYNVVSFGIFLNYAIILNKWNISRGIAKWYGGLKYQGILISILQDHFWVIKVIFSINEFKFCLPYHAILSMKHRHSHNQYDV